MVEEDGAIIGYADLQPDGYIDHFYCHYDWQGRGVGSLLMQRIHNDVRKNGIIKLYANISITAKPFFVSKGFKELEKQMVSVRGQQFINFKMEKWLKA